MSFDAAEDGCELGRVEAACRSGLVWLFSIRRQCVLQLLAVLQPGEKLIEVYVHCVVAFLATQLHIWDSVAIEKIQEAFGPCVWIEH